MSFIKASSVFLLMISALFGASMAAVYQVGDSDGWNAFGTDYKKWAATKNFLVGDSIVFNYNPQFHNVVQVSKQDYDTCTSSSPLSIFNSGSDSIPLPTSADYYFICGFPGNCQAGQKVSTPVGNSVSTGSGQNLPPPHLPQYDPTMTYGGSCPLSSGNLGLLIMVGSLLLAFQLH
ncbi:Cupredoxin superfamily protein [Abeliophyllum distichum]|uniref:Cupredoxin superfamily protein n=1 Tax=Abeliophyllum distichum TaxID=126358 RepID=A0ABD1VVW8_9LAMI